MFTSFQKPNYWRLLYICPTGLETKSETQVMEQAANQMKALPEQSRAEHCDGTADKANTACIVQLQLLYPLPFEIL